jgi:cholesterol oxidase
MQSLDNSMSLKATRRWFSSGVKLRTQQNPDNPNPTYIDAANRAAAWLAEHTGGIAQSGLLEATANIPPTAHLLGGAVIGEDIHSGVIDEQHRAFGYENLLVCDGSAVPANPGVNPSLTITAMTERAMAKIPEKAESPEQA